MNAPSLNRVLRRCLSEALDQAPPTQTRVNPFKIGVFEAAVLFHPKKVGKPYKPSSTGFHKVLADVLDKVITGHPEYRRVMISAPPQHGKSELIKTAISLALARNPFLRIVYGSYGASLAEEASQQIRDFVYSDFFQKAFGRYPHSTVKAVDNWKLKEGGGLRATGVGGGLTGHSADLAFVDDPHKDRAEANSEAHREKVKGWFNSTLMTRVQGEETAVCIIQTRWHEDDLTGHLQSVEETLPEELKENWKIIVIPALATDDDDILGREIGEAAYPEKYSIRFLLGRQAQDPLEFEALYQGRPTIAAGDLFADADFVRYENLDEIPPGYNIDSWDTAQKDKEKNDYSAFICTTVDFRGDIWIRDFGWKKVKTPALKPWVRQVWRHSRADFVLIEDKGSGIGLIQEFQKDNPEGISVIPMSSGRLDKVLYSGPAQGKVKARKVHVPAFRPDLPAFLAFFMGFPNARYDDPVDCLSQLVQFIMRRQLFDDSDAEGSIFESEFD